MQWSGLIIKKSDLVVYETVPRDVTMPLTVKHVVQGVFQIIFAHGSASTQSRSLFHCKSSGYAEELTQQPEVLIIKIK